MNINEMLMDGLRYPLSNWKCFFVFYLVFVFQPFFIGVKDLFGESIYLNLLIMVGYLSPIFIYGYEFKVIQTTIGGINELPSFNELINMFVNGLKLLVSAIIYFIIPIILFTGIYYLLIDNKSQITNLNLVAIVFCGLICLSVLLTLFFYGIGLANLAYKKQFNAAFNFNEIIKIIKKIGWKKYLTIFILICLIGTLNSIFNIIGSSIGIIGILVMLISTYSSLTMARLMGSIYKEAT
jgi:hypothetical protein